MSTTYQKVPEDSDRAERSNSDDDIDNADLVLKDGVTFPASGAAKTIGVPQLVFLIFFCVSGGPYGLEDAVNSAGPGWVLAALLAFPILWNIPMGLLTSELSSAMPSNGGYIIWVARAFGPFWAFQEGYLSWVSNIFDNSLYPSLCVTYLQGMFTNGQDEQGYFSDTLQICLRVGICIVVAATNIAGLEVLGKLSIVLAIITLLPFVIMSFWALPQWEPKSWFEFKSFGDVSWGVMFSTVLWNNSGWDSPSAVAGSVKNPKRTYPVGIFISVIVVLLNNLIPLVTAISVNQDYSSWDSDNGFWAGLGQQIGGNFLRWLVILSSVMSNLGMFNVVLTTSSWALYAIALPGLMDIPLLTNFESLIQADMTLNSLSIILEIASLVWLRIKEPEMPRPYKIPLGTKAVTLFVAPAVCVCLFTAVTINNKEKMVVGTLIGIGIVLFALTRGRKARAAVNEDDAPVDIEEMFAQIDLECEVEAQEQEALVGAVGSEAGDTAPSTPFLLPERLPFRGSRFPSIHLAESFSHPTPLLGPQRAYSDPTGMMPREEQKRKRISEFPGGHLEAPPSSSNRSRGSTGDSTRSVNNNSNNVPRRARPVPATTSHMPRSTHVRTGQIDAFPGSTLTDPAAAADSSDDDEDLVVAAPPPVPPASSRQRPPVRSMLAPRSGAPTNYGATGSNHPGDDSV